MIESEFIKWSKINMHLLNLLAVIHGDGGHYTDKHGIDKSVKDAIIIVSKALVKED